MPTSRVEIRLYRRSPAEGQPFDMPWPVAVQCQVLRVSRSGFYDYLARQSHPVIDAEETTLIVRIQAIAAKTRLSYGSRRMAKALQDF